MKLPITIFIYVNELHCSLCNEYAIQEAAIKFLTEELGLPILRCILSMENKEYVMVSNIILKREKTFDKTEEDLSDKKGA